MQYIKFYFSPYPDMQYAEDYVLSDDQLMYIEEILYQITNIDHGHWRFYQKWFETEENTGESQPVIEYEIQTVDWMIPKMASVMGLLEYENTETFKTIFNEMIEHQYEMWGAAESVHTFMTRVGDGYFSDLDSWGRYLTQETTFDESSSINAVGGGVLYVMIDGIPRTFCNDTVCDARFCLESKYNIAICVQTAVGMGRDSSGLSNGMLMFLTASKVFVNALEPCSDGIRFRCPVTWWIPWSRGFGCCTFNDVQQRGM